MSPLTAWANFYVIVGTSAGALTGLTFVAITLVAGRDPEDTNWGISAFTSPTLVQFGMVLLVSAMLSAPWPALWPIALLLALSGLGGMAYSAIVVRRWRRRGSYEPVREDWIWYMGVPVATYLALLITALFLPRSPTPVLFGIGAEVVLLLLLAIHNAWDIVTFVAAPPVGHPGERSEREQ